MSKIGTYVRLYLSCLSLNSVTWHFPYLKLLSIYSSIMICDVICAGSIVENGCCKHCTKTYRETQTQMAEARERVSAASALFCVCISEQRSIEKAKKVIESSRVGPTFP